MNDLFSDTCPCCGRPYEATASTGFDEFWQAVPQKIGKEQARKAWKKLNAPDRAQAAKMVKPFYAWFAKTYPTASPLHPSTYLNNKRWQDDGIAPTKDTGDVRAALERGLKSKTPAVREHAERMLARLNERGQ